MKDNLGDIDKQVLAGTLNQPSMAVKYGIASAHESAVGVTVAIADSDKFAPLLESNGGALRVSGDSDIKADVAAYNPQQLNSTLRRANREFEVRRSAAADPGDKNSRQWRMSQGPPALTPRGAMAADAELPIRRVGQIVDAAVDSGVKAVRSVTPAEMTQAGVSDKGVSITFDDMEVANHYARSGALGESHQYANFGGRYVTQHVDYEKFEQAAVDVPQLKAEQAERLRAEAGMRRERQESREKESRRNDALKVDFAEVSGSPVVGPGGEVYTPRGGNAMRDASGRHLHVSELGPDYMSPLSNMGDESSISSDERSAGGSFADGVAQAPPDAESTIQDAKKAGVGSASKAESGANKSASAGGAKDTTEQGRS